MVTKSKKHCMVKLTEKQALVRLISDRRSLHPLEHIAMHHRSTYFMPLNTTLVGKKNCFLLRVSDPVNITLTGVFSKH